MLLAFKSSSILSFARWSSSSGVLTQIAERSTYDLPPCSSSTSSAVFDAP